MAKRNVTKVFTDLFSKAEKTSEGYEAALEKHQLKLVELQQELNEKEAMLKDLNKMKLLEQVSKETYDEELAKVKDLRSEVQEINKEMILINEYQNEDAAAIIAELDAVKTEYNQHQAGEINKLKLELIEAKYNYLVKMAEARKEYGKIINNDLKLQNMKVKHGLKNSVYISGSHDALNMYSVPNGGYESLRVEQREIFDALEYGRVSSRLGTLVNDAKDKGILKSE
jgi:hypothetical protein